MAKKQDIMIRLYRPSDYTKVLELLKLNIPDFFAVEEESDYIDYLEHKIEDYFVVENENKIIGAGGVNYFPKQQTARIAWDIIHPEWQGKGIGKKLTEFRISHVNKNPLFKLIIVRTSQLAYPFYEKMGFDLEKVEKDFWSEGLDLYQMKMMNDRTKPI